MLFTVLILAAFHLNAIVSAAEMQSDHRSIGGGANYFKHAAR